MPTPTNIKLSTESPEREAFFRSLGWNDFIDIYDVLDICSKEEELGLDTETTGLSSYLIEDINALQLSTPREQFVIDFPSLTPEAKKLLKKLLESKTLIGHNLLYDLPFLFKHNFQIRDVIDTMQIEGMFYRGLDFTVDREINLAATVLRNLNIKLDKAFQTDIAGGLTSVEAITYAGIDVRDLHALKEAQLRRANNMQLQVRAIFDSKFIPACAYWEFSGVRIDKDRLREWTRNIEADEVIMERKMKEYADINWNSSQQVGPVLAEYGIEYINEETDNYQTGDEILSKHLDIPVVKDLSEHRSAAKLVSTYGRKWFHYIQADGRIHTRYKASVETGRTSSGATDRKKYDSFDFTYKCEKPFPNLQNVVNDNRFRRIFVPKNGNVFVDADYDSQEVVIMADQSGDRKMQQFIREGKDMHSAMVRMVYPELADYSDEEIKEKFGKERTICKRASFAIAYGGNGNTIANNVNCSVELGNTIYETYMGYYTQLPDFFEYCYDFAWKHGYMPMDPLTGGKRFFDRAREYYDQKTNKKFWDRYKEEKQRGTGWYTQKKEDLKWYFGMTSTLKRESVNTRIQGTAAVMTKLASIYFTDWIFDTKSFDKVKVPLMVHDQLIVECHKKRGDEVAAALKDCMERAGAKCLSTLSISTTPKICYEWQK